MGIHKSIVGLCLFAAIVSFSVKAADAASFIVEDGKANAEIITSPEPTCTVKLAAEEMQLFINKISGAELPILNKPSGKAAIKIYLGESEYTKQLGLLDKEYKDDSYRIASGKDYLAFVGDDKDMLLKQPFLEKYKDKKSARAEWNKLSGGLWSFPEGRSAERSKHLGGVTLLDGQGTLNGVYDFLRALGVRWYLPGEVGECVPELNSISLPEIDKSVTPDFTKRIFAGRDYKVSSINKEQSLWIMRLGLKGIYGHSNGISSIYGGEKTATQHPEWFRLKQGKRVFGRRPGVCLSTESFKKEIIKFGRTHFDFYDGTSLGVAPGVGAHVICQCDLCMGKDTPERGYKGTLSDYVWGFGNDIAKALYKAYPDKRVQGNAYTTYSLPPLKIEKMSPNISVLILQNRHSFVDPEKWKWNLNLRKAWLKKLTGKKPLCINDNYIMGSSPFPMYIPHIIAEDIRLLKGISYGEYIEELSRDDWGGKDPVKYAVLHLNMYVTTRLWWDADQDIDVLLEDYYEKFYGPAAKEMKTFIEFCEASWAKMNKDVKLIDEALDLIAIARKAAGEDSLYAKRVAMVDAYLSKLRDIRDKVEVGRSSNPPVIMVDKSADNISVNIDGKFEEAFWKDANTYYLHQAKNGEKPEHGTWFKPVWKDDKLYLAIHCEEDDIKNMNIGTRRNEDMAIWNGETLEIFLETQNHAYYQLVLNPAGAMIDIDNYFKMTTGWSSEAKLAIDRGTDYWSAELEIPVADQMQAENNPLEMVSGSKPVKENPWHINIGRVRLRGKDHNEVSMFGIVSIKGKLFQNQDRFAPLYIDE